MRKLAANPGDHQAAAELVEIIKRNRAWNDEWRAQAIAAIFRHLGVGRSGDGRRKAQAFRAAFFLKAGETRAPAPCFCATLEQPLVRTTGVEPVWPKAEGF
jgi:hypothetical protein